MTDVRQTSRRWLFRGARPNRVATLLARATAVAAAAGFSPKRLVTLEVRGRRTGRVLSLPVVVTEHEGERYLVAMLGNDANWIRNVRADGGRAVLHHRSRETVRLEEVEADRRAPILKRYLELAPGARAHFPVAPDAALPEFEKIAAAYPVFRVDRA